MTQERIEYKRYDKAQLEELVKTSAVMSLIGSIYYGKIGSQEVRWCEDGSIEVFTKHIPAPEKVYARS